MVEQPAHNEYGTDWPALRAALFDTDRPVLVVPAQSSAEFGRRVAIAWRDDARATNAVLSALHWLTGVEHVLALVGTRGDAAPCVPPILAGHGIAVEVHTLPTCAGPLGGALLDKAHELGADMLGHACLSAHTAARVPAGRCHAPHARAWGPADAAAALELLQFDRNRMRD